VLPSLVIKIEYYRTLHRGSKEPSRPGSVSCVPALEKAPISGFRATKNPLDSSFWSTFLTETASHSEIPVTHSKQTRGTFLTETRIADFGSRTVQRDAPSGLRQGTAFYPEPRRAAVPSHVCPDEETSIQLNYSSRAASSARASGCALSTGATNVNFGPLLTGLPRALFAKNSVCPRPFLTGSASQTESPVTHSKQTTAPFLTGARTHIKPARRGGACPPWREFANPHFFAPENLLLHPHPIQIFLRPTI
jgi:hypothetical protein